MTKRDMTKRDKLQKLVDSLIRDDIRDEFSVIFKYNQGWYLVPTTRLFFDENDMFLGHRYDDAVQYIKSREFYSIYG